MKRNNGKILFLCSVLLATTQIQAQNWFPDNGFLFDQTNVARVDIKIDQSSIDTILEPGYERRNDEYEAIFTFKRGASTSTIDSIGFRLRGNTSRYSAKKSFKVSLNTFIRGQKYHGVEKINLNGEHNDPSISRAFICWELFRRAGVPASRAGFTELYINNEYKGLYINVEHIDEEFTQLHFGNNDGNLYKCLWPADLSFLGDNPELYKFEHEGRRAYELKNNLLINDYSDIATLAKILNEKNPDDYPQYLEPIFNVNTYLKNLVVEVLTGHWDAYSFNKNNYYLYHNESTGKFEYIPYDPDNTLGISWADIDWASRDIYKWNSEWGDWGGGWDGRPLTEHILQNEIYRDRFSFFMNRFLVEEFNAGGLDPFIDAIKNQINTYAETDLYRTYDYGYSYNDFLNSYDQAKGAHVRYGIKPFISTRAASALSQLDVKEIAPAITMASINDPDLYESIEISALVEDELTVSDVTAYFSENGGAYSAVTMTNSSGDMFSASYPGLNTAGNVSFYIEATDQQSLATREPPFGAYTIYYKPVSVPVYTAGIDMLVYPNPARSVFTVDARQYADNYLYSLYNISGQLVHSGASVNQQFTVELNAHVADGLYFIEVKFEENGSTRYTAYKKLIIHK